jgi:RNA polymerase subunit RPABC4/transcription elongation factor Spt4
MVFDPTYLSSFAMLGTAFAAAFLAALWLSLIFWTYRDIKRRSRDMVTRILAALVVTVLFLPGILVYIILRPPLTLEEDYQQTLEEEALLQTIEDVPACPGCSRKVQADWIACPSCHTRLKKKCHNCGKLMELAWNVCPYCASAVPVTRTDQLSMDDILSELTPLEKDER